MAGKWKSICIGAAVCSLVGCAHTAGPLVGTWRLVSSDDQAVTGEQDANAPIKILNEDHFAFGSMTPDDMVFSGGGWYEYSPGVYTEIPTYHSHAFLIGRRLVFNCELKGDLWYHSGRFDIGGRSFSVVEVWKRVKNERIREHDENLAEARRR